MCKTSAILVAVGPPVLVCVPLAGDVLVVVIVLVLLVLLVVLVVAEALVAVVLLTVAVVGPALGVPRMPPWAVAGTL